MKTIFLFTCIASLAIVHPNFAQTSKSQTATRSTTRKEKSATEADRLAKARRAQAVSLLTALASDAASFDDLAFRTRSLIHIADLLWDVDADQARILLGRAWDTTALLEPNHEDPAPFRDEVLKLAAKHDPHLVEKFLADQAKEANEKSGDNSDEKSATTDNNWWSLPDALEQRLRVAENFLETGDTKRAVEFGEPLLNNITISTVEFVSQVRDRDEALADRLYAKMLAFASQRSPLDPRRLSMLSSYLFTPGSYVTPDGSTSPAQPLPVPNSDPALRLRFFEIAAGALIQPMTAAEPEQTQTESIIRYSVGQRLLPFFERYAPPTLTASLRAQMEMLETVVGDQARAQEKESRGEGFDAEQEGTQRSLLDQIERAKTAAERDALYVQLALRALQKNDDKARDYADKIDDSDLRKRTRSWVDWRLARRAIEQKKFERALSLERTAELSHIQRVWLLTQVAKLTAQSDRDEAVLLINKATAEVERIENSDPDRPRGFFAIANALRAIEATRAWEAAFDAVKAANSIDTFTGEDSKLKSSLHTGTAIFMANDFAPDFAISGIFSKLSKADPDRTIDLARGFQRAQPRAVATIAIATALLKPD